ncbi:MULTISPECIES: hypothetical protein [Spiroplasma]|uniref:Uncharacterized protein n=1 Tax=Spiroplasma citri TaxID=2133 RepID=A0AAJ4EKW4_SPICI|nr:MULTISPECIES: hypothetical protein [Spiroplasma]MBH8623275.1 hypothetical protein [Spiroplasma sp. hyd1]QIA69631.1 hypothetical protein GL298_09415 [Spiroplasma citri]QIA71827.1 hypothetical protein GL981_11060 [Spiroplasma citri]QIA71919.1 hypothetical protein GL981_11525 [Spiroplasma citri]QJU61809.1 hypothetical protein HHA36_05245 [Spiroplasma citri]
MIKKIYLNQNLISQEINNKTHILINKQKDCVVWDKNGLGLSSYQNYFSLEIDENKNYMVHSSINNKNGNIVGKNLLLTFEKLKQENKKQFNSQNKINANNDLLNEYNNHYDNKTTQRKLTETELKQLLKDLENIDNPNYWDNGFYLGYNKYEKIT